MVGVDTCACNLPATSASTHKKKNASASASDTNTAISTGLLIIIPHTTAYVAAVKPQSQPLQLRMNLRPKQLHGLLLNSDTKIANMWPETRRQFCQASTLTSSNKWHIQAWMPFCAAYIMAPMQTAGTLPAMQTTEFFHGRRSCRTSDHAASTCAGWTHNITQGHSPTARREVRPSRTHVAVQDSSPNHSWKPAAKKKLRIRTYVSAAASGRHGRPPAAPLRPQRLQLFPTAASVAAAGSTKLGVCHRYTRLWGMNARTDAHTHGTATHTDAPMLSSSLILPLQHQDAI